MIFEGALAGLFGSGRGRGKRAAKTDALYQAQSSCTRRGRVAIPSVALAKQALEISPDCADAYVLLAEHTSDLVQARRLMTVDRRGES